MAAALGLMRQFNRISSCALPRRLSQIRYLHSERLLHKFCTPRSPLKARTIQPNFQKGKRARGKIKLITSSGAWILIFLHVILMVTCHLRKMYNV